jgi:hypothetical protein
VQKERIRIEREKLEMKRKMEGDRIIHMDMSNLSYKQQQYFERHQDKILAKCYNT